MPYEQREGETNVFANKFKTDAKHPDFKAKILWKGEELDIALWKKQDKNGKGYVYARLSESQGGGQREQPRPQAQKAQDDDPWG